MINGKHGKGTHSTKKGADKSAENTPKVFDPICLPKPKSLGFSKKKLSLSDRSPWLGDIKENIDKIIYIHDNSQVIVF